MNNSLRGEMMVVMSNEQVCDECQVRILALASRFLNNPMYVNALKDRLDLFFSGPIECNLWIELPKMVSSILDLNKTLISAIDIDVPYMKFCIYVLLYNYLHEYQPIVLDRLDVGEFRICLLNLLDVLMIKPSSAKIVKQTLWSALMHCICADEKVIKLS